MSQTSNNAGTCLLATLQELEDRTMGPWSFDENLLYINFLEKNKAVMSSKKKRKQTRIFDRMSEYIRTRNPLQCRSHHQKLLEKMGDSKIIIKNFKKNVGKKYYKQQYQECILRREANLPSPCVNKEPRGIETQGNTNLINIEENAESQRLDNEQMTFQFMNYAYFNALQAQLMSSFMMPALFGGF